MPQRFQCRWCQIGQHMTTQRGPCSDLPSVTNQMPAGAMLHILPDTTKEGGKKWGRCIFTLTCDALCMSTWLQLTVYHYAAAHHQFPHQSLAGRHQAVHRDGYGLQHCLGTLSQAYDGIEHVLRSEHAQHQERQHDSQAAAAAAHRIILLRLLPYVQQKQCVHH